MHLEWLSLRRGALAASTLSVLLLGAGSVRAGIAIAVSPARVEFDLEPGQSATRQLQLFNRGDVPLQAVVYMTDLLVAPTGLLAPGPTGKVSSPAASWVSIRPERSLVAPGKAMTFEVTVALPADVETGGYLELFVNTVPATPDRGTNAPAAGEIGVQCLIRASTSTPQLTGRVVEVRPPTATQPLSASVEISNVGPVHAWADVSLDVLGPFGDFVGTVVPSTPGKMLLLPGQRKIISMEWPGSLAPSTYDAIATVYFDRDQAAVAEASFVVPAVEPGAARTPPARARPGQSPTVQAGARIEGSEGTAGLPPMPEVTQERQQGVKARGSTSKHKKPKKARAKTRGKKH